MRNKKGITIFFTLVIVLSIVVMSCSCAPVKETAPVEESEGTEILEPVHLRMAGMEIGGTFQIVAATLARVVENYLPSGSTVETLPYAGGAGNVKVVSSGDAQIGASLVIPDRLAYAGEFPYEEHGKMENLRSIAGGFGRYYVAVIIRKDSGITSLEEVVEEKKGVRLLTQDVGALGEVAARQLLYAYNIDYETIKEWGGTVEHTSISVIEQKMKDGMADIWVQMITVGHPTVTEMALTTDLVFLQPGQEALDRLVEDYGYEVNVPLPASTFKGQDEELFTPSFTVTFITTDELPDDLAYLFAKAVYENKETLVQGHVFFEDYEPDMGGSPARNGVPLHPGAVKFYQEKGLDY